MPTPPKRLNYEFLDNDADVLIIAFQSAGRIPIDVYPRIQDSSIPDDEVRAMHDRLNWMKFAKSYPKADYLFPKDYYSKSYGWYVCDGGDFFHEQFARELDDFITERKYRRVVAFGSSKGGTASLLYGMMSAHITDVFAMVPQIEISRYWKKHLPALLPGILGSSEPESVSLALDTLMSSKEVRKNVSDTNFWTYTGIKDDQYKQIIQWHDAWGGESQHNLVINTNPDRHTPLVSGYQDFLLGAVRAIAECRPVVSSRLSRIQDGVYLYS